MKQSCCGVTKEIPIAKEKERKKKGRRGLYCFRGALEIALTVTRCEKRRFVFRCLGSGQAGFVERIQLELNLITPLQGRHTVISGLSKVFKECGERKAMLTNVRTFYEPEVSSTPGYLVYTGHWSTASTGFIVTDPNLSKSRSH